MTVIETNDDKLQQLVRYLNQWSTATSNRTDPIWKQKRFQSRSSPLKSDSYGTQMMSSRRCNESLEKRANIDDFFLYKQKPELTNSTAQRPYICRKQNQKHKKSFDKKPRTRCQTGIRSHYLACVPLRSTVNGAFRSICRTAKIASSSSCDWIVRQRSTTEQSNNTD